jgi:hypothetical protein
LIQPAWIGRDDLAVAEDGAAGNMIEMPVAENDREFPHAFALELVADIAGTLDRDVRVVDQRLAIGDYCVAGDTQRQGAVIHPVRVFRKAIALMRPS